VTVSLGVWRQSSSSSSGGDQGRDFNSLRVRGELIGDGRQVGSLDQLYYVSFFEFKECRQRRGFYLAHNLGLCQLLTVFWPDVCVQPGTPDGAPISLLFQKQRMRRGRGPFQGNIYHMESNNCSRARQGSGWK